MTGGQARMLIVAAVLIVGATAAAAREWYVAPDGVDGAAGAWGDDS
ncbi:MAG TPA: hypothetical protein VLB51_12815 [Methylomirabilota bacterium]|nr:hypothetical protein [Methylomirabilota bacterium]